MKSQIIPQEQRIGAFAALGQIMRDSAAGITAGHAGVFAGLIDTLHLSNPWFTPDNVRRALNAQETYLQLKS